MRLSDKTEIWSSGTKRFCGKYKRKECNICYTRERHWYYYFLGTDDDKSYNSLWDNKIYNSKEECHDACVKYIDDNFK